jgi:lipid II:glycine glycyltransferase (peptidoglycan interpeptide bridge formation enzyme)
MRHNVVIDLTKSEEQLLAAMKSKFRYNVKLGLKHDVKVTFRTDDAALEIFFKLFFQTVGKQKYFGRNPEYYRQIWRTLQQKNQVMIAIASYNNQPLSAWMLFKDEEVLYYPYGGSSNEHREVMANNVLVWEIVRWAKLQGFKQFDLWGIHKPRPDGQDDGYTRFKLGIGADVIEYESSYDLVISWFWYILFRIANVLRWVALKLGKLFR